MCVCVCVCVFVLVCVLSVFPIANMNPIRKVQWT